MSSRPTTMQINTTFFSIFRFFYFFLEVVSAVVLASVWWSLGSCKRRDMGPENLSCVMNFDTRNSSWPFGVPWKPPPRLPSPESARIIYWLAGTQHYFAVHGCPCKFAKWAVKFT